MKGWKCNNCGHIHKATDNLEELGFKWLGPRTSRTSCENCGSYTLNKAWNDRFTAGEFLIVKAFNKIRRSKIEKESRAKGTPKYG